MKKLLVMLLALVLALGAVFALAEELELELPYVEELETELWTDDMAAAADAPDDAAVMPAGAGIAIDAANFPDETLRNYLLQNYDDGDGVLSDEEVANVTGLYLGPDDDSTRGACASVAGIELLPNLKELFVQWTSVQALDVSRNPNLEVLVCPGNGLTSLDVSKNLALKELVCWDNPLTALDVTRNTRLTTLECGECQLTALDVSKNTELEKLTCDKNQLKQLDVTTCPKLVTLWCNDNQLTALDVSKNTRLRSFWCHGNLIPKLDIRSDDLKALIRNTECAVTEDAAVWADSADPEHYSLQSPICAKLVSGDTVLASFGVWFDAQSFPDETLRNYVRAGFDENGDGFLSDIEAEAVDGIYVGSDDEKTRGQCASLKGIERFPNLKELFVQRTSIKSVDVSGNPNLEVLACNCNGLKTLDVSNNPALKELYCWDNELSSLDVTGNTQLKALECSANKLTELNVTKNTGLESLNCENNQLKALDVSKNTKLQSLWCNGNLIAKLDIRSGKLKSLIKTATCKVNADTAVWKDSADPDNFSLHTPTCANLVSGSAKLASFGVWIDKSAFPDKVLRKYVLDNFDSNGDGFLFNEEAKAVKGIYVGSDDEKVRGAFANAKGIEHFPNLKELFVQRTNIKTLDVSKNTKLEVLACNCNGLKTLDVSKNKALKELYCWDNPLTALNVTANTKLTALDFGDCRLTAINLTRNKALRSLRCAGNKLNKLNVGKCAKLVELWCDGNALKTLDVSNNKALTDLRVGDNKLKALDIRLCTKLKILECGGNALKELNVTRCRALTTLDANGNKLSKIDVSKNSKLEALYCNCSGIKKIDIAALPAKLRSMARKNKFKVKSGEIRIIPGEGKGLIFNAKTTVVDGKKVVYSAKK